MKNNILFILCFLFLGIIIYPDRCRAIGVPDQIVVPPSPVEPPQCLKVGDNNSFIFSAEKSSYVFELQSDPVAERFVADYFPEFINGQRRWGVLLLLLVVIQLRNGILSYFLRIFFLGG